MSKWSIAGYILVVLANISGLLSLFTPDFSKSVDTPTLLIGIMIILLILAGFLFVFNNVHYYIDYTDSEGQDSKL